ncbi:hypothetical protein FH972_023364 [Carpinus fangiana]|uniref:Nephrocystin 3-like N-terminal domain-containing protein n=1 Tax=Carpinus fangiana TaxID=176857 RepID=A0A5N6KV01_9ROSI|nr:hypothetical protein FH972_023364 [Carpinus fangiana]
MESKSGRRSFRVRQLPSYIDRQEVGRLLVFLDPDLGPVDDVNVVSLASGLSPWEKPPMKMATVTFERLPRIFQECNKSIWTLPGRSYDLAKDVFVDFAFLDFTVLRDSTIDGVNVENYQKVASCLYDAFSSVDAEKKRSTVLSTTSSITNAPLPLGDLGDANYAAFRIPFEWSEIHDSIQRFDPVNLMQWLSEDDQDAHKRMISENSKKYLCTVDRAERQERKLALTKKAWSKYVSKTHDLMMKSLQVSDASAREATISETHPSTFSWVLDDADAGLKTWLRSGTGCFWIQGKPGSGKSTLMKYLWKDKKLHSMIHSIPKADVNLIKEPRLKIYTERIFIRRGMTLNKAWELQELEKLLQSIISQNEIKAHVFLFLDALDEFNGPKDMLCQWIQDMGSRPRDSTIQFSILFAARPWNVFTDAFHTCSGFKMEDYTSQDIRDYAQHIIQDQPMLRRVLLLSPGSTYEDCKLLYQENCTMFDRENMQRRIKSRTGGLLETVDIKGGLFVQFLHQSAKDFLQRPDFVQKLISDENRLSLGNGYDFLFKSFFVAEYMHYLEFMSHFVDLREAVEESGSEYESRFGSVLREVSLDEWIPTGLRIRAFQYGKKAETATGTTNRRFLDSITKTDLEFLLFPQLFTDLEEDVPHLEKWRLCFAAIAGFELYVRELIEDAKHLAVLISNTAESRDFTDFVKILMQLLEAGHSSMQQVRCPVHVLYREPGIILPSTVLCSLLHVACINEATEDIVLVLLRKGAEPIQQDSHGLTPADWIVKEAYENDPLINVGGRSMAGHAFLSRNAVLLRSYGGSTSTDQNQKLLNSLLGDDYLRELQQQQKVAELRLKELRNLRKAERSQLKILQSRRTRWPKGKALQ